MANRPPAPPKPQGWPTSWTEGVDYSFDNSIGVWISIFPQYGAVVWDDGAWYRMDEWLADQGDEGGATASQGGAATATTGQGVFAAWPTEILGPFPTYIDSSDKSQPDVKTAQAVYDLAVAMGLIGGQDEGERLREAIAEVEAEIAGNQATIGPEANEWELQQRLADLRAQYAKWQESFELGDKGPVGTRYGSYQEALEDAPEGYEPVPETMNDGSTVWTFKKTAAATKDPRRSLDDILLDYIMNDQVDEAIALYTTWENMTRPKGLTPQQAMSYIENLAVSPAEMEEWIDALTDDWNAPRTPQERVPSPTQAAAAQGALTAAERNAMSQQAPVPMGAGIPAGLAGQGAGGLQFPSWMTTPGGMPPTTAAPTGTPFDPTATGPMGTQQAGIPRGVQRVEEGPALPTSPLAGAPFDPAASALQQTYADMDSAYRVGVEMQSRTGKEYRVVRRGEGYGLIEAPTSTGAATGTQLGLTDEEKAALGRQEAILEEEGGGGALTPAEIEARKGLFQAQGSITSAELARQNAGAQGGIEGTLPQWLLPPNIPEETQEGGIWPAARDEVERQKRARGQPYITGAGYTFVPTMQYGEDRTPPAYSALFYPGADVYELTDEERARANARSQQAPAVAGQGLFQPTAPLSSTAQRKAWHQRGDIALAEQNLFGLPYPLTRLEAQFQVESRRRSKRQQELFTAQPGRRTVFR